MGILDRIPGAASVSALIKLPSFFKHSSGPWHFSVPGVGVGGCRSLQGLPEKLLLTFQDPAQRTYVKDSWTWTMVRGLIVKVGGRLDGGARGESGTPVIA